MNARVRRRCANEPVDDRNRILLLGLRSSAYSSSDGPQHQSRQHCSHPFIMSLDDARSHDGEAVNDNEAGVYAPGEQSRD